MLVLASSEGHEEVGKILLDNGADVNAEYGSYGTALTEAVDCDHVEVVELLLENGADINALTEECGTPSDAAQSGCCTSVITLLEGKGARTGSQLRAAVGNQ